MDIVETYNTGGTGGVDLVSTLRVLINDGPGSFTSETTNVLAELQSAFLQPADLDGDGGMPTHMWRVTQCVDSTI